MVRSHPGPRKCPGQGHDSPLEGDRRRTTCPSLRPSSRSRRARGWTLVDVMDGANGRVGLDLTARATWTGCTVAPGTADPFALVRSRAADGSSAQQRSLTRAVVASRPERRTLCRDRSDQGRFDRWPPLGRIQAAGSGNPSARFRLTTRGISVGVPRSAWLLNVATTYPGTAHPGCPTGVSGVCYRDTDSSSCARDRHALRRVGATGDSAWGACVLSRRGAVARSGCGRLGVRGWRRRGWRGRAHRRRRGRSRRPARSLLGPQGSPRQTGPIARGRR